MKSTVIVIILLLHVTGIKATLASKDTSESKFFLKVTEYITRKCNLTDSISKKFYCFLKERINAYGKCRKDTAADIPACKALLKKMEIDIEEKFGKNVYDAYYPIAHPPPCFPTWRRNNKDSIYRKRRLADQR